LALKKKEDHLRELELALAERERAVAAREAAVEQRMRLLGTHSAISVKCAFDAANLSWGSDLGASLQMSAWPSSLCIYGAELCRRRRRSCVENY